jgi:hypothetical protein
MVPRLDLARKTYLASFTFHLAEFRFPFRLSIDIQKDRYKVIAAYFSTQALNDDFISKLANLDEDNLVFLL